MSGFFLDRFEVTLSRFASFVSDYPNSRIPKAAAGAHPRIAGSGWRSEWETLEDPSRPDTFVVPRTREALIDQLSSKAGCDWGATETTLPINCVNWYMAFAFCIWDGGRLPTEAEWGFAASAGKGFPFPWSTSVDDITVTQEHANYDRPNDGELRVTPVGNFPAGAGFFKRALGGSLNSMVGHDDLAGNVAEWVADGIENDMPQEERVDYMAAWSAGSDQRILHGGAYDSFVTDLLSATRVVQSGALIEPQFGFRCARDATADERGTDE